MLGDAIREHPGYSHQGAGLAGGRAAMAFKLIGAAQDRWRAVNAPHLVALVRAGARFGPRAYESRQLVVTLPGVIRTVTHCGSGPANPG